MAVLVTGGAGYIGSHTVIELLNTNQEVVIVDDFSNSNPIVLGRIKQITNKDFKFYEINILNQNELEKVFVENNIDSVIHFAAYKATLAFYENVKENIDKLKDNHEQVIKLNDQKNMQEGARGKAIKEYNDLSKTKETEENSKRVKDIRQKYLDTTNYLDVIDYVQNGDIEKATEETLKIKDGELKERSIKIVNNL